MNNKTLDSLWYCFLIIASWVLYVLFSGWRGYFFPKVTVIKNDADLLALKKNIYNRYAVQALDTVIANTECLYPITFSQGTHWLYSVDIFSVENAKCRSVVNHRHQVTTVDR